MVRPQIILGCLAFIVVWVLAKWLIKRRRGSAAPATPLPPDDLGRWYQDAQYRMAVMDAEERRKRIARWDSLPDDEQLALAERFLQERIGPRALQGLSRREKLALGKVSEVTREQA